MAMIFTGPINPDAGRGLNPNSRGNLPGVGAGELPNLSTKLSGMGVGSVMAETRFIKVLVTIICKTPLSKT